MTVGVFSLPGGTGDAIQQHLTGTGSPVIIAGAGNADYIIRVHLLILTALTGTPTVAIDIYDGATAFVLRASAAMTASTSIVIDQGLWLRQGSFLRVTASAAVDAIGVVSLPNTQGS